MSMILISMLFSGGMIPSFLVVMRLGLDVFDANKLNVPENYDQLYEVCKTLKSLNPDIYPFILNNFLLSADMTWNQLRHMSIAWGTDFPFFYDKAICKWTLALENEGLKELLIWLNKMHREKLMPSDVITMTQDQYRELLSNGKSLITYYYCEDLDRYNKIFESKNENAFFEWMKPPKGMINGQHMTYSMATTSSAWSISKSSKVMDEAIKYVDWFYSDTAKNLVSWGIEGESYKVVDGRKQYIIPAGRAVQPRLLFTEEERADFNNLYPTIIKNITEGAAKFIIGDRDFSEWDAFIKEIKDLGSDDLIDMMNVGIKYLQ